VGDLSRQIDEIAHRVLGAPHVKLSTRAQLRFGKNGSVAVEIDGPKAGTWFDHETRTGGSWRDLVKIKGGVADADIPAWLEREGFLRVNTDRSTSFKIVAAYDYCDETGKLLFQVCRLDPKTFRQRRPNGKGWEWSITGTRLVPYRLPELFAAAKSNNGATARVYIVEGEKDVDRLTRQWGLTATTNPGGAGKWHAEYNKHFAGFDVVILPDNDDAGRKHAQDVAANLYSVAASVRILELPGLPVKGDVSDWLDHNADATQSDFETLVENAEPFMPQAACFSLVSAAELVARQFKEPRWAVPQMIAEGLAILAGKPKTGKSWAALDFAVAVAGGYPALGNIACEQGDVLLLALEDNDRRLHQRLKAVLQGQPAPAALQIATRWRRADEGGLDDLRAWLKTRPRARLVVIDTLQMIRGARAKNDGVYADDYQAVGALKAIADESNVPFLVVHHLRKEAAGDPLESVSGTAGITGSADTILVLKREPKDAFALLYVRGRDVVEARSHSSSMRQQASGCAWSALMISASPKNAATSSAPCRISVTRRPQSSQAY